MGAAGGARRRRRARRSPTFVERAKASGFVAAALARHRIEGALVAPAARRERARMIAGADLKAAVAGRSERVASAPSARHAVSRGTPPSHCPCRCKTSIPPSPRWFSADVPCADRGAGRRLAGDPRRPPHARRRADRLGQDADRLPRRARRPGARRPRAGRPRRRDDGRLRLAAEGALERHPRQPRGAARRHPRRAARARPGRRRHPHRRAHRRHARRRAAAEPEEAAAHPGDDARVALRPARLGLGAIDAGDRAHRHRRRDPRRRREQARQPPRALARAAAGDRRAGRSSRIGLSATQKPIDEVARFLVGAGASSTAVPIARSSTSATPSSATSPSSCRRRRSRR